MFSCFVTIYVFGCYGSRLLCRFFDVIGYGDLLTNVVVWLLLILRLGGIANS